MLTPQFFDRDAQMVAKDLLGKIIRHRYQNTWLSARIIETEAYYLTEKGSHASLGFTQKRSALFMPAGTIYMYYARGGDSLNISCQGEGNAVLIKSAIPFIDELSPDTTMKLMQQLNPLGKGEQLRERKPELLCAGQTLLCRSMNLKVHEWDQQQFDPNRFYFDDVSIQPDQIIQTRRCGIPKGRDEHLLYRFIDYDYARFCTANPLTKRNWKLHDDYLLVDNR